MECARAGGWWCGERELWGDEYVRSRECVIYVSACLGDDSRAVV